MNFEESSSIANNKYEPSNSMDEYVIVEPVDEIRDDDKCREDGRGSDTMGDDASYDYCEDFFEGVQNDDDDSIASLESESAQKDNFILTVPSGLMKDLDEAHAAAKLVRSTSEQEEPEEIPVQESSAPADEDKAPVDETSNKSLTNPITTSSKKDIQTTADTAPPAQAAMNLSRASNKKRRKKLKLMKKAKAASSAAQNISARAAASSSKSMKGKKVGASPSSSSAHRGTRKVANIAVACARETMAAYRNEVLCSSVA